MKPPSARKIARIATKITAIYLLFSVMAALALAELTLHPYRRHLDDRALFAERYAGFGAQLQDVTLRAGDGAVLRAWYSVPEHNNGRAVILLHGVGDNREGVAGYGDMFLAQGYSILLPDSRAHGESGGRIATYGLLEADDIHRWVSWLYERGATCVDGFGESMGAALVIESLRAEPRYCAIVADSPFSTFRAVAYDREGFYVGIGRPAGERWFGRTIGLLPTELALLYARERYGVNLLRANPVDELKSSTTPVLLIHGLQDINILPRHSLILARSNPQHVQLWLVPQAYHCGAVVVAPEEFRHRVLGFFDSHSGNTLSHASN